MPEGPEIRHHAQQLMSMVGKRITWIHVLSGRYMKRPFADILKPVGEEVLHVRLKGKLIGIYLKDWCILTTAGMSGQWVQGDPEHKFKRIQIRAGNLLFTFLDQRNFGTFKIVKIAEADEKFASLGPDIFEHTTAPSLLFDRITKFGKNQTVSESLLDQRIFAGVGNYIRAEAMFIAKVDPRSSITQVPPPRIEQLWEAIHAIAEQAYVLEHQYVDLCYRREKTNDGRKVESFLDLTGRTVWYVPGNAV